MHARSPRTFTRRDALALVASCACAPAFALDPGAAAPGFELPLANGSARLADYAGKVLYLDFWASWCAPCRQSFPWMNEMLAKYEPQGLRMLAINVDKKQADALKFLERVPAKFQVAFDPAGNTPRAYQVKAMPSSFLIGPAGRLLETHQGFADEERPQREAGIRRTLKL